MAGARRCRISNACTEPHRHGYSLDVDGTGMGGEQRFRFKVLGRYQTQHEGNELAVTVNLAAGWDDHLVHCGTLTMSESEWVTFVGALKDSLGDGVQVEDRGPS
jgi:hypothetical protein